VSFDQAAINAVYAAAVSTAKKLAVFENVIQHEPKAAPVSLPACAVWTQSLTPVAAVSGLSATSGRLELRARIYLNFLGKPEDKIDPELVRLTSTLLGAYSGGFTFGGTVMEIDLLGAHGQSLSMTAGFIQHDAHLFRVAECNIPVIIDSLWTQGA
jgi:hypothetical protein